MQRSSSSSVVISAPCALCLGPAEDLYGYDSGVCLSCCCHNPICRECTSRTFPSSPAPLFCLICSIPQRLSGAGILVSDPYLKYIYPNRDGYWKERKTQIETFFATARKMPGCSFFFHNNRNQYSWKNLDTPEIAEKYNEFTKEMDKITFLFFWTRFCSIKGIPNVSTSMRYIVYSTHPFFPWIPERRKVMSRCQFGVISMIANRLVSGLLLTPKKRRNVIMQILRRFLAKS